MLGAGGQLGLELEIYADKGGKVIYLPHSNADICDKSEITDAILHINPSTIINCAAYTAVDRAEAEPQRAFAINADGVENVARAAARVGARLIHISTDYVFDGCSRIPYTPADATAPLSVYGESKLQGEERALRTLGERALVIRSAWLHSARAGNFVSTILRLLRERDALRVIDDQVGSPTQAGALAQTIWCVVTDAPAAHGVWHWAQSGAASWHGFACEIQRRALALGLLKQEIPITAIPSAEYPQAARRPAYSVLDCAAARQALGVEADSWQAGVGRTLQEGVARGLFLRADRLM
nr:dTDP-4-dehydrorhamnose reductase [Magnetofaba australis]